MYIKRYAFRFGVVFIFFILFLSLLLLKLILIQAFRSTYLQKIVERQHNLYLELEPQRGTIYDRNLRPLALNLPTLSLYAIPHQIKNKERLIKELVPLLGLSKDYLVERLDRKKYFIWIARKLSSEIAEKIKNLKIEGLDFIKETKRYYPNRNLASHVIGFAGLDNVGLEGIELYYDNYLKGRFGWCHILRDGRQRELLLENKVLPPQDGHNVVLTIDETIQYIAERELDLAFRKHKAKGAIIIIMDPKTGEILALANRPTFDLNSYQEVSMDSRRNRAICDVFEPGSVFKIVTASAAVEEGRVSEQDRFFCENGQYKVANHILHDHRPHGWLTFSEVIEQSSNIGTTKVAQALGPQIIYKYVKLFGFGSLTGIDLPGEISGMTKEVRLWSKTSIGAIPIGQEVTVTALQLVTAISCIANNGVYNRPYIVKYIKDKQGQLIKEFDSQEQRIVIKPDTAKRIKEILTKAVENGTGRLAKVELYRTVGKTGTAQKVEQGTYSHKKFFASFIGFVPADEPQIAMAVVFDEPHPFYFGGTVAAPVFKKVAEDVLRYLNSKENQMEPYGQAHAISTTHLH